MRIGDGGSAAVGNDGERCSKGARASDYEIQHQKNQGELRLLTVVWSGRGRDAAAPAARSCGGSRTALEGEVVAVELRRLGSADRLLGSLRGRQRG